jgi:hypothetical protein
MYRSVNLILVSLLEWEGEKAILVVLRDITSEKLLKNQ